MSDRVAGRLSRWFLGFGSVIVLGGCGGTVLEHNEPGGSGGATSTGGRPGTGAVAAAGKAGALPVAGKTGAGGKPVIIGPGTGGKTGAGATPASGGRTGTGGTNVISPGCPSPFTYCPNDGCVDTQVDNLHCGSCFATCPSGAKCLDGICTGSSSQTCAPGTVFCANFGECLDTKSNPFACGSCSTPCNGTRCNNGTCDPKSCISPTATFCPSGCSELSRDFQNCGACGNQCGPADSCQGGKCVPPQCDGATYCRNTGCTDTTSDTLNCGGCDKSCFLTGSSFDGTAYSCNNGTCSCSFNANKCGKGCASAFWYCPPDSFMGQPADFCKQTARNAYEACACASCLPQVQACFTSPSCVNSMDCTLNILSNPCPTCQPFFQSCSDQMGNLDPLAEKLVQCMNSQCSKPTP
jgi:hypothetical protein